MINFRDRRIALGVSQKDISESLKISLRTYQRMEKDPKSLSQNDLQKIASIIDAYNGGIVISEPKNLPVAREKEQIKPANTLKNHIGDREMEIIVAFRELSADKQELYYYKIKAEALEERLKNQPESPSDAKYA